MAARIGRPQERAISLSDGGRDELERIARSRSASHGLVRRAKIILASAGGETNGILWVLRTGAPWRDMPERYGLELGLRALQPLEQTRGWGRRIRDLASLGPPANKEHAAGAKGGTKTRKRSDARAAGSRPKSISARMPKATWKDYPLLEQAVAQLAGSAAKNVVFIAIGEEGPTSITGSVEFRLIPFVSKAEVLASYYRAADLYIHPARADTFPNVVLEALACGTPVVATATGGIPEQVRSLNAPGVDPSVGTYSLKTATGLLTQPGNAAAFATAIELISDNKALLVQLSENAARDARLRFSLELQTNAYLEWFSQIKARWPRERWRNFGVGSPPLAICQEGENSLVCMEKRKQGGLAGRPIAELNRRRASMNATRRKTRGPAMRRHLKLRLRQLAASPFDGLSSAPPANEQPLESSKRPSWP